MAKIHEKPSVARGWRFDDDLAADPRWTSPAYMQNGRFLWTLDQDGGELEVDRSAVIIYVAWETDARVSLVNMSEGDQVVISGLGGLVYRIRHLRYVNADTPDRELGLVCQPIIMDYPLIG